MQLFIKSMNGAGFTYGPVHPKEAKGSSMPKGRPCQRVVHDVCAEILANPRNMAMTRAGAVVSFQLHRIIMRALNQQNILSNFAGRFARR
jgi:hypothetical protein